MYTNELLHKTLLDLSNVTESVTQDEWDLMLDEMIARKGIGIAAPQVGIQKRAFIMQVPGSKPICVLNPVIVHRSKETYEAIESCLSVEGPHKVRRHSEIYVAFRDAEYPLGPAMSGKLSGLKAQIFQHEYDHLKGIMIDSK